MKIALVNPPRYKGIPVIREERCEITERYSVLEPYSLLQMAAILREDGHRVELIDCNGFDHGYEILRSWLQARDYESLMFRFTPTTFDHDMQTAIISKELRPDASTIGVCWTLKDASGDVLNSCKEMDIYLRHEYEVVAGNLVDALDDGGTLADVKGISYQDSGEATINPDAKPVDDFDSVPMPAYDLLPSLDPYFINTPSGRPFTILYSSKGCPFNCIFCTVANTKWRARSAENILNEVRFLKNTYGVRTISFFDETFTIDRMRAMEISEAMKSERMGITWYCNTRVHLVDLALLREMRAGGCKGISYGVESGSQEILNGACKGITVKHAENAIRWAKQAGMKTFCSFVFGLPGETWKTVGETIDFVKRTSPTGAQFNVAVPYPGTRLHEIAMKNGWIRTNDWRNFYQHKSVTGTESMSATELDEARRMAYRSLYTSIRWMAGNAMHVIRNPEDFPLAMRYCMKIVDNFIFHGMEHAH